MFWIFILIAGFAATFSMLGMYAVWFRVLAITLHAAVIIIFWLAVYLLWRRLFARQ
jgi:hypothetical protein